MYGISNSSFLLFFNFDLFIDNFDTLFSYSNKQDNWFHGYYAVYLEDNR